MDIISLLKTFGYGGVWTALFIEGAVIFGIFLPGDSLLFPIGVLAGQDVFNLWIMLPGCFVAAFLGNLAGYEVGKRWGPALLKKYGGKIIKDAHLQKCHYFFETYVPFTVVIARFIHFAHTLVPFVAVNDAYGLQIIRGLFGGGSPPLGHGASTPRLFCRIPDPRRQY